MASRRIGTAIGLGTVLALGAMLLVGGDADAASDRTPPAGGPEFDLPVFQGTAGAQELKRLAGLAGLHPDWILFLTATAFGESRFTSNVVLGDPALLPAGAVPSSNNDTHGAAEARASVIAYERAAAQGRFDGCPWPATAYTYGSGGWLGMIPANAWAAYAGTPLSCRHPWLMLHPVDQVFCAIEMLRRLSGWSAWQANPTMLTARVAWGAPDKMADPSARERMIGKFGDALEQVGLPRDWWQTNTPSLPAKGDVYDRWQSLMQASRLQPGPIGA